MKYRVEQKYLCDAKDLAILQSRLKMLLKKDTHAGENGEYIVRSVYFDDYQNRCYYENEDGVENRDKYRIRFYGDPNSIVKLEIKSKRNTHNFKQSCILSKEIVEDVILNSHLPKIKDASEPYKQLCLQMKTRLLRPKVIVEYVREAYVYKSGNVRITLDKNIVGSSCVKGFFSMQGVKVPILETGQFVLEVKYDEFLPSHIYNALGLKNLQQTSFSKYYLSRKKLKANF
ncbi:MAG: polyphosphate polymerase domain-containing protein [Erysipelotrichaceae bacterium]